ncbi:MAG: hypothetical protein IPK13_06440 [Deltaproteobacteria bacterium]|nr:hypothetical protein [Deltaproteobacteria bacterium]
MHAIRPTASLENDWPQRLLRQRSSPAVGLSPTAQAALDALRTALASGTLATHVRTQCLCGSANIEPIARTDRHGLNFGTVLCRTCGLVQQDKAFDEGARKAFREQFTRKLTPTQPSFAPRYEHLDLLVAGRKDLRIAHIGLENGVASIERLQTKHPTAQLHSFSSAEELKSTFDVIVIESFGAEPDPIAVITKARSHLSKPRYGSDPRDEDHARADRADPHPLGALNGTGVGLYLVLDGLFSLHERRDLWFDYLRFRHVGRPYEFDLTTLTQTMQRAGFGLLAGDERIEAAFTEGHHSRSNGPTEMHANKVAAYLSFCEMARDYWTDRELEQQEMLAKLCAAAQAVRVAEHARDELEAKLKRMEESTSWKLTRALRGATAAAKKLRSR